MRDAFISNILAISVRFLISVAYEISRPLAINPSSGMNFIRLNCQDKEKMRVKPPPLHIVKYMHVSSASFFDLSVDLYTIDPLQFSPLPFLVHSGRDAAVL